MGVIQKKVCLLGDFSVGKTSLIRRFVEGSFDDSYISTIGVKVSRKRVVDGGDEVNLMIWDLAGGDDFRGAQSGYLLGTVGALIVCDLTRPDTLGALWDYSEQLRGINREARIVFAGNKVDLVAERQISDSQLQAVGDELGGPVIYTSAKTGDNVEEAFFYLAQKELVWGD
ncbi:MAG TPA: Rab family GTPase [Anaerolineae bacterium]|nr:Rab family GTPase [Anaerolineae bacterium]